jgi:hypothetical protein
MGFLLFLAPLAFAAYHLAMRKQVTGRTVLPPSRAAAGRDVSVVGIAQPWETPEISEASGQPVLWSRVHRIAANSTVTGRRKDNTTLPRLIGKTRTHFQVVDEHTGAACAVDSPKLREVKVRNRQGPGSRRTGRIEEHAVYPGDRVWIHGRLEDRGGHLGFGRGAVLHDEPPEQRARKHGTFATIGLAAAGVGAIVAVILAFAG